MTLLAEPILTADTAERYEVIDPAAVRAYLASRPHLVALLEEAPAQIARFFPDAPLSLACQVDPDDNTETLIIRVRTNLVAAEANQREDELLDAWILDLPYPVRRDVLITLGEL
jgi:hypothetical protein